jgi:hypothetical protein
MKRILVGGILSLIGILISLIIPSAIIMVGIPLVCSIIGAADAITGKNKEMIFMGPVIGFFGLVTGYILVVIINRFIRFTGGGFTTTSILPWIIMFATNGLFIGSINKSIGEDRPKTIIKAIFGLLGGCLFGYIFKLVYFGDVLAESPYISTILLGGIYGVVIWGFIEIGESIYHLIYKSKPK